MRRPQQNPGLTKHSLLARSEGEDAARKVRTQLPIAVFRDRDFFTLAETTDDVDLLPFGRHDTLT
jgi:hypothetical protein